MYGNGLQSPGQSAIFDGMIGELHTTVSFTGHRTYGGEADALLRDTVRQLYARGMRTFLSGMALGFDLAAAEAVLACRSECAELRLVAVIPFAGQELRLPGAFLPVPPVPLFPERIPVLPQLPP